MVGNNRPAESRQFMYMQCSPSINCSLTDLLMQFTSLQCPYVFAPVPLREIKTWVMRTSVCRRPSGLLSVQHLPSIKIILALWFSNLASSVCLEIRAAGFVLWYQKHPNFYNYFMNFFSLSNNLLSRRQQLSAISGCSKYCICEWSVGMMQKVWLPFLWARISSFPVTCCSTDVPLEHIIVTKSLYSVFLLKSV